MTNNTPPIFTQAQIEYLEKVFKPERPRMTESRDEIFYREGQLSVVEYLRKLVQRQMEKS